MSSNHVGQPPKLTQAVHDFVVEELGNQNYIDVIMEAQGISRSSYYVWLRRGAKETREGLDTIYTRFAYAVAIGKAKAHLDLIRGIAQIGAKSPDEKLKLASLIWIAERKDGRWNKANKQVSVDLTKEELQNADDEELKHLLYQVFGETPTESDEASE